MYYHYDVQLAILSVADKSQGQAKPDRCEGLGLVSSTCPPSMMLMHHFFSSLIVHLVKIHAATSETGVYSKIENGCGDVPQSAESCKHSGLPMCALELNGGSDPLV